MRRVYQVPAASYVKTLSKHARPAEVDEGFCHADLAYKYRAMPSNPFSPSSPLFYIKHIHVSDNLCDNFILDYLRYESTTRRSKG